MTAQDARQQGASGTVLLRRALAERANGLLDTAIDQLRAAVQATPLDDVNGPVWRANLGAALRTRYERTGGLSDLRDAVAVSRDVVAATDPGDPALAGRLGNLGVALRDLFTRLGNRSDLDDAVEVLSRAVRSASPAQLVRQAANLGGALLDRYELQRDAEDLDQVIESVRDTIRVGGAAAPAEALASAWSILATACRLRFLLRPDRDTERADLDEGVAAARRAVDLTGPEHPKRARYLSTLGSLHMARYHVLDGSADLADSLAALTEAEESSRSDTGPTRAECLASLGIVRREQHLRFDSVADLDAAIHWYRAALELTDAEARILPARLSNLAVALVERSERSGADGTELDEGMRLHARAVQDTVNGDPDRVSVLFNYGGALLHRFDQAGAPADCDAAIENYRHALRLAAPGHPSRAEILAQLGQALRARHHISGTASDLHEAVAVLREAVDLLDDQHPWRGVYYSFLGSALRTRFFWHGSLADLDEAADWHERAAAVLPADHAWRVDVLRHRAFTLRIRAEHTRAAADIDAAITVSQEAVDAATDADGGTDLPERPAALPALLAELGSSLALREERVEDITATITTRRRVCALCPADDPRRPLAVQPGQLAADQGGPAPSVQRHGPGTSG